MLNPKQQKQIKVLFFVVLGLTLGFAILAHMAMHTPLSPSLLLAGVAGLIVMDSEYKPKHAFVPAIVTLCLAALAIWQLVMFFKG